MNGPQVSPQEAIKRSIHQYVAEKSAFAVAYVNPELDAMAQRLIEDLDAFGYKIVRQDRLSEAVK